MSYNNYVDADAARAAAYDFDEPGRRDHQARQPVRHRRRADVAEAHRKAHACDPVSAFGGVIATNRRSRSRWPSRSPRCSPRSSWRRRTRTAPSRCCRQEEHPAAALPVDAHRDPVEFRRISGGLLMQRVDHVDAAGDDPATWTLAAGDDASADVLADLAFAWKACRAVRSNAILLASGGASVGVGMGQVNRVDSCRLAVQRAGERATGSVAASDAFFPFADGPQILVDAGVRAIVQPGGSVRDAEVVEALERPACRCTSPAPGTSRTDTALSAASVRRLPAPGPHDKMTAVTAQILDGNATLKLIKQDLTARVATPRSRASCPASAPSWSVTTPAPSGTSPASTRTAPRSASPRSASTCRPPRPRPRSRPTSTELNADPACTGYIVQLPLPSTDENACLGRSTRPRTSTACTRRTSAGWCSARRPAALHPYGIVELLRRHDVQIAGAEVVVRRPWRHRGPPARPAAHPPQRERHRDPVPHRHPDLAAHVRSADIVVAAAGVPGIITGDMVKPGAAVLDVGVSRVDGKIAGDVAEDVYDVAGWVSPNPGGVGPMTRAMLLSNIVSVAEQSLSRA
jgi:5,10-methylene-tetrahydrofolate dehydrogenase/methenyl tetrahydrofolate cyclohydrolase